MCTLLIGRDVTGAGEIVVGANRDEDPARPSDPPNVLVASPRIVGGRDRVSGGTWLALRAGPALTMLLNRPPVPGKPPGERSRGLLVMDVAAAADPRAAARAEAATGRYGPCTLVFASPDACWWLAISGTTGDRATREGEIAPGWHAITHAELDDLSEPRTRWLSGQLGALRVTAAEPALEALAALLAHHGDATSPAVCIHSGRMPTVSASLVFLARERTIYRHTDGRPCTTPFVDVSTLLAPNVAGGA